MEINDNGTLKYKPVSPAEQKKNPSKVKEMKLTDLNDDNLL